MKKVLIIDASHPMAFSEGRLGKTVIEKATEVLEKNKMDVRYQHITEDDSNYSDTVNDMVWADLTIYQIPTFWMTAPWTLKKWQDEAWDGRLFASDGRHSINPAVGYGTGGALRDKGKRFMISTTWNAPKETFITPDDFGYKAGGVDGMYMSLIKAHEFIGFDQVKTFMLNDVIKTPNIEENLKALEIHLDRYLGLKVRDDLYK